MADSGPGVPAEQRELLFRRFYRQGGGQGAGLGLSIVQRIVELHRGEIRLDESPLGGLAVEVWLPRAARRPAGRQAVANERPVPASGPGCPLPLSKELPPCSSSIPACAGHPAHRRFPAVPAVADE